MRKDILVEGEVYHICTKSIAGFNVFNNDSDFERMQQLIKYYKTNNDAKFSDFIVSKSVQEEGFNNFLEIISKDKDLLVQIIAYCFMPTHIHLILKQLSKNGISDYMRRILNSYSSYFNTLHQRRGPLWESRFKNVLVKDNEQLLHLTRYAHLNPVTAHLCNNPNKWQFSSYKEYLSEIDDNSKICQFDDLLNIKPSQYRKFVNDRISYQRELSKIKKLMLD
jgi:putative transposase